tara:strand:+ start:1019 stop:1951 length:933 start_codon:yes stop_codon:yes gene_type:complete
VRDYAVIFPGQGSQNITMLQEYSDNVKFNDTIDEASEILGYSIKAIVQEEKLNNTLYTQPVLLAVSNAIWNVWKSKISTPPKVAAGHSLGEYSALVAAEALSLKDGLELVSTRASLMVEHSKANPTAMAAVIGLDQRKIIELCKNISEPNSVLEAVNFNSSQQTVIGGHVDAIDRSVEIFKKEGAKIVKKLSVSLASHTSLLEICSKDLNKYLNNMTFKKPVFPIIHNFDASSKEQISDIINSLSEQVCSPVRWTESMTKISTMGVNTFLEVGPGQVLSGLNKRIDKNFTTYPLSGESEMFAATEGLGDE